MGVALPTDLVGLGQVNEFLGLTSGHSDEPKLLTQINALTDHLIQVCSRDFVLQYVTELRNGTGQTTMFVLKPPIVSVYGVNVSGHALALASNDSQDGVVWDENSITLRGAAPLSGGFVSSSRFAFGFQNLRINYLSGWQLPNQTANDWQASTAYYPHATIQPTSNNPGNFIYAYQVRGRGGAAMSGSSRPTAFMQTVGSLTIDGAVTWTNLGITAMPDALPYSFGEACAELVALRYRQQQRWGDTGTGVGPERVNYYIKGATDSTHQIIKTMINVVPVLP